MGIEEIIGEFNSGKTIFDKRDEEPNEESYHRVGSELGNYLKRSLAGKIPMEQICVSVGGDCRESTPRLIESFIGGILSSDISVLSLGYNRTTPSVEWSGRQYGTIATAMITASHFGPKRNGLKLAIDMEASLAPIVNTLEKRGGVYHAENASYELYRNSLHKIVTSLDGISISVDCMNGAAAGIFCDIARQKGARVVDVR